MTRTRPHWNDPEPWQTNAALIAIGYGLIRYTQQLIVEGDHFVIGDAACSSASLALYVGAILILLVRPGGPARTNRFTLPIVVAVAIAARIVGLFPDPILSTDVYRYAWDGVVQHAHINPYRYVPGDPALAFLRAPNQDLFDNINRRDYAHTIYPPVAQMIFYAITWLNPTVAFMKTAMVLFEGLTLYGLSRLLRQLGLRQEWLLVYAWCPLCLWEFGSSGHLDSVCMAFIVLAFCFRFERRPLLTGLFLGLAVFTKFYPIILFPALYQRQRDGRLDWKMPVAIATVAAISYSAYLSVGWRVFGFLGGYAKEEGMDNGTRFFPLEFVQHLPRLQGIGNDAFLAFAGLLVLTLVAWTWRTACQPDSAPAAFLRPALWTSFAMMLIFSPHYPWYVAWLLPFVVLTPSLTVFTYLCALFYLCTTRWATGSGAPQFYLNEILYSTTAIAGVLEWTLYRIPGTRRWMRQLAPYCAAYPVESTRSGAVSRPPEASSGATPQGDGSENRVVTHPGRVVPVSVIIPALNEAESIGQVVREMPWPLIAECIVVDNGSTDRTAALAGAAGARVVESPRGYGAACLAGSQAALPESEILVYMDGDGSDIVANLPLLTGPIAAGEADFVLCSRIRGNREPGSMLPSQIFAAHLVSTLLRIFQGVRYTDMGPFRAIRRSSLEALGMSELTYGWNLEMQIKAAQHGLRIREVTVDYRRRLGGTSKVSGDFRASVKAAVRILEVLFRVGLSRKSGPG